MGVCVGLTLVYFLTVCLCIHSAPYTYGSYYGYTPYVQYYPGQRSAYGSYPRDVSSQSLPYYGYPVQPQSYPSYYYPYPLQSYYSQTYQPQAYPTQQTSVQPQYNTPEPVTSATNTTSLSSNVNPVQPQPYYPSYYYPYPAQSYYPQTYQPQIYPSQQTYPSIQSQDNAREPATNATNSTSLSSNPLQPQPYYPSYYYPYPAQSYYPQTYQPQAYPSQQRYPSVQPQYNAREPAINATNSTSSSSNVNQIVNDPHANIKTEIIDIEPKYFNYYKRFFNLENNTYPIEVVEDRNNSMRSGNAIQTPYYTVKMQSKSSNLSTIPKSFTTHDVKSKTYSFKRTFTLDPNNNNNVIKLNFVNGVQITTTPEPTGEIEEEEEEEEEEEATVEYVDAEPPSTTTESDEPANILSWV